MNVDAASTILQLITRTATPVVLIAACATLILGVNSKQSDISTRIRTATMEFRQTTTTPERRRQLYLEICTFRQRFYLTWLALCSLYLAVIFFIITALLILLTERHLVSADRSTLYLFSGSILLMLIAVALELGESALATRSLRAELSDISAPSPPAGTRRPERE